MMAVPHVQEIGAPATLKTHAVHRTAHLLVTVKNHTSVRVQLAHTCARMLHARPHTACAQASHHTYL